MYLEIDFPLEPAQRRQLLGRDEGGSHDFRKAIARGATQLAIPEAAIQPLMNYGPGGVPLDGQAPIWFSTYPRGVRVTAIGERGVGLLSEAIGQLHKIICAGAGGIVPMIPRSGDVTIGLSHPRTYYCGTFAFAYKHRKAEWWKRLDEAKKDPAAFLALPGVRDELADIIKRSLIRGVTDLHGESALEAGDAEVSLEDLEARLLIRVDSAQRLLFVEEGKGRTLALKGLELTTNAELSGPWAVGRFASRGCGRLRLPMSADVAMQVAA